MDVSTLPVADLSLKQIQDLLVTLIAAGVFYFGKLVRAWLLARIEREKSEGEVSRRSILERIAADAALRIEEEMATRRKAAPERSDLTARHKADRWLTEIQRERPEMDRDTAMRLLMSTLPKVGLGAAVSGSTAHDVEVRRA